MITHEDTYDVADKVLEIPTSAIRRAPDNVRADLGDLEGLAASIREVGVLQPITVTPDPSGDTFVVLYGARRHAATEIAGLLTVPSIVRTKPEDVKRVMTMLIENVQRSDLTEIDEGRTFERLEQEFSLSQRDIADRVGCSQAHVSKRIQLLELPELARTMVVAKTLTLGDALELVKLAGQPDKIAEILDGWADLDAEDRQWRIAEAVEEVEKAQQLEKLTAEYAAKGVAVLDSAQAGRAHKIVAVGDYAYGKHVMLAKADVKKHTKEPCHAIAPVWRFDNKFETDEYCTSADRHGPKGDSKIKAAATASSKSTKPAAQVERERREKEITKHRTEFVTAIVRDHKLDRSRVTANALTSVALDGYGSDHEKRARLLGLDLKGRNPTQALTDYVAGGTDHMIRACLATMLKNATSPHAADETLALLTELGYEPSPLELEHRDAQAAAEAERIASREAWEAYDRAEERAQELNVTDHPRLAEIQAEIDEGVSANRALELQGELDAMFAELNNLQGGDVVEHDGEGHTIARAVADPDDELVRETADIDSIVEDAGAVLCAFPRCKLNDEHEGDHELYEDDDPVEVDPPALAALTGYVKPAKDCSNAEAWCRSLIDDALEVDPEDADLLALQQELFAGVDDERALEIRTHIMELTADEPDVDVPPVLTDYQQEPFNGGERRCRSLIDDLPADHPRVIEIQQILYRGGLSIDDAGVLNRELKALRAELVTAKA